ncbi:MAG TPA: hypothetical protein VFI25_06555 [Planctomycetota bacterium]|nr:hypothetical protein [Planctomycetota bacterium]
MTPLPPSLRRPLAAALVFVSAPAAALAQCAMCKEALESGTGSSLSRGMAWTILLLLGTLFSLVGGFVFLIVRHGRTTPAPPPTAPEE